MRRSMLLAMVLLSLGSCTVYFDVPVPSEDAPVDTAPYVGTWEGLSLAGEPVEDPVTLTLVDFGADLRFALTATQGQGGAEETIAGEVRLADVGGQTFASARVEGTAGWIMLRVSGPEGDELRFRPVAQDAMEQALAARVVSGTAQNSALGARGLFIHEDEAGMTRFLAENPGAFDDGAEAVLRRVDAGEPAASSEGSSGGPGGSGAADSGAAPNAVSRSPVVRALLGTVAGVFLLAMVMVAANSRGRRRR